MVNLKNFVDYSLNHFYPMNHMSRDGVEYPSKSEMWENWFSKEYKNGLLYVGEISDDQITLDIEETLITDNHIYYEVYIMGYSNTIFQDYDLLLYDLNGEIIENPQNTVTLNWSGNMFDLNLRVFKNQGEWLSKIFFKIPTFNDDDGRIYYEFVKLFYLPYIVYINVSMGNRVTMELELKDYPINELITFKLLDSNGNVKKEFNIKLNEKKGNAYLKLIAGKGEYSEYICSIPQLINENEFYFPYEYRGIVYDE